MEIVENIKQNRFKLIFNEKTSKVAFLGIVCFIIANSLKITLFNFSIIPQKVPYMIAYKLIMTTLAALFLFSIILSLKSRAVFLAFYIIQTVYILTNMSYYLYYHSYLNIMQWVTLFQEAFISTVHSSNPKSPLLLIAFIDTPFAIFIFYKYFNIKSYKSYFASIRRRAIILSSIAIIAIEVANLIFGYSIFQFRDNKFAGEVAVIERYGTALNSIVGFMNNHNEEQLVEKITYGNQNTIVGKEEEKPNFVFIQVESMDSNIVNQKHKDRYITPFLNSLTRDTVYYPYTLSYHKGGGTSDSEFSVINSVEPLDNYPAIKLQNYDYPNSMVSILGKDGYKTMAFHGNLGSFYNRDMAFPKMGFQEFYDIQKMGLENKGWGASDGDVFSFALNKLSDVAKPFLSYIISMTSHGPFTNARNFYDNSNFDDIEDETVKNYFHSMSYVDKCIQELVQEVKVKYPNTYIFIFGDHSPNIGSEDYNQASFKDEEKYFEFVPLFILTPDGKKYKETSRVASFLDILPTVLYSSGINCSANTDGENLLIPFEGTNKIPLKEIKYDRRALFDEITKVNEAAK